MRTPPPVAVIGAGIVGVAIAARLAERNAPVLLLDAAAPGQGVTRASFAWVNANQKLPRAYYDLNVAGMQEYQRLAWQHAPATWYHRDGNLIWYTGSSGAEELAARVERLREWGYAAELLPAAQVIVDLEPAMAGSAIPPDAPVGWFPQEAWVDAAAMIERLIAATRNGGGRVLPGPAGEVTGIGREGDRVTSVTLRGGQALPVRAVVNAAGPAAPAIAALVGRDLPMQHSPGLTVRATLPEGIEPLLHIHHSDLLALRPDGPGRILMTLDSHSGDDLAALPFGPLPLDHPQVGRLVALAAEIAPVLATAQPVEAIIAPRVIPGDGYPSVGGVPAIPGYYEAVTHSGVTLGPLIGRALTAEILGEPPDPLFAPYRPERFAGA
ncbi:MAG: FAD-binding oxidoreductase [Thermomicrobiales bacterium]